MELSEITIPGDTTHGDAASPAVTSSATDASRGIVVIHELFGRQPEIDRVVLRFAEAGYAAIAPDLFSAGRLRCIRSVLRSMQHAEDTAPLRQALRARSWLCEHSGLRSEQVGLIGFCFGGMFALAAGRSWSAVSTNYGDIPKSEVMRGIGPVIACYGGRDRSSRGKDALLRKRLQAVGVEPEVHVYPEAGHSFLTDGSHPVARALTWPYFHLGHHPASAEDAWPRIFEHFARTLPAA